MTRFIEANRRQFLAGLSAVAAASVLPEISALAQTPRKGGKFRYAIVGASTSDAFDPSTFADIAPGMMSWQSRSNIVDLGPDLKLKPELAESFEGTEGARKWVFRLRQGVEFHNGKSLAIEDLIYSLRLHIRPDSKSSIKPTLDGIAEMKADGKNLLVITLKEPNADFPFALADYHAQIVPDGTTNFNDGMGTGPYVMKSFDPGVRCTGTRFANYWKDGHGNFDEVECFGIADSTARMNGLVTGDLDAVMFVDTKTLNMVERAPGIKVIKVQSGSHMTLPMLTTTAPFDNNDVRLALKFAIDRQELVDKLLRGNAVIGNDHPIPPGTPYFAADLPQRGFDPEKSRFHLKKAGLDKLAVPLSASNVILDIGADAASLYRESAAKAGIDIQVVQEPADGYWSNVWQKKPFCESYFGARPTPDAIFSLAYGTNAPWNETFWSNGRFDELMRQGRAELDEAKRKAIYGEMQRIVHEEGGTVVPFFPAMIDATSDKIATGTVAGNLNMDGGRAADRWWFA